MSKRLGARGLAAFIGLLVGLLAAASAGAAESAKVELYALQTTTLSDEQFLTGAKNGVPAVIAAELRLPRLGTDRLPAIVIVHGSLGILGQDDRWSRELNALGIASFILDGFTGRGIVGTAIDQSQLGMLAMINDAYRALDLLAKHPRIDPARIGIMGGSRGGSIALYAAVKRFQRMYAAPGLEFAVYLPFYAVCNTSYIDDEDVSEKPIRLFHGSADEYAPVDACRSYVERLRRAGKNAVLTEYSGAHHMFDNPIFPVVRAPQGMSMGRCRFEERAAGQVVNLETGRPVTVNDACFHSGGSAGYNPAAHAQAVQAVRDILKAAFKLP